MLISRKKIAVRAMAALLAFIMFSAYVPQFVTELRANPFGFSVTLEEALVAGGTMVPTMGRAVEGQATVSWQLPAVNTLDRLVVPLREAGGTGHEIAVIHVLRTGPEELIVDYRVYPDVAVDAAGNMTGIGAFAEDTGIWSRFRANFGAVGGGTAEANYLLRDHPSWVTWNNEINPVTGGWFNPHRIVVATPTDLFAPPIVGVTHQPMFRIEPDGGFSFGLQMGATVDPAAAHNVHFWWNSMDDTFHLTLGGLQQGGFYDFALSRSDAYPNPSFLFPTQHVAASHVHTLRAFTGFVTHSLPLALHREDASPPSPPTSALGRTGANDELFHQRPPFLHGFTNWDLGAPSPPTNLPPALWNALWNPWNILDHSHPLHMDPMSVGENDFLPGYPGTRVISHPDYGGNIEYPDNRVMVHIELPWEFDPTGGAAGLGTWQRADESIFSNIILQFNVDLRVPPNIFDSFSYVDIFGSPQRVIPIAPPFVENQTTAIVQRDYDPLGNPMPGTTTGTNIYIKGLEPSRIFHQFHILIPPPSMNLLLNMVDAVIGNGILPINDAHTFLEFDVVFIGGNFHVRIFPYQGAFGDYTVVVNNDVTAPVNSEGVEVIFIPLEPPGNFTFLQVRFSPSMPGMNDIYSQVMFFVPTSDRIIFSEPGNFVVHPDNPPLTTVGPHRLDEATFFVDVGWDLATVGALDGYFDFINSSRGTANPIPPAIGAALEGALPHPDTVNFPGHYFLPHIYDMTFTYALRSRLTPWASIEGAPIFTYVDVVVTRIVTGATQVATRPDGTPVMQGGTPIRMEWDYTIVPRAGAESVWPTGLAGGLGGGFTPFATEPESITISAPGGATTIRQGRTIQMEAEILPAGAIQNVAWSITGLTSTWAAHVQIDAAGQLSVSDTIPHGTTFNVVARAHGAAPATPTDLAWPSAILPMVVIAPEQSMAINPQTWHSPLRIGVGGSNGLDFGGIRLDMIASRSGVMTGNLPHFWQFPNIYHLTAQLVSVDVHYETPIRPPLPESNAAPMTLDLPIMLEFPPPQNLQIGLNPADEDNPAIVGGYFDLTFDVPLERIWQYIATSPFRELEPQVMLRIFLGESQADILQRVEIPAQSGDTRTGAPIIRPNIIDGVPQTLDAFTEAERQLLRSGVVVIELPLEMSRLGDSIQLMQQQLKLHGLDRNRQYFVAMDAFITFTDSVVEYTEYSLATNVVGITTMADLQPPDPGYMIPPIPGDLQVDDVTVSSADLSWLPVEPMSPEGTIRYEIVRMRANQLPEELLGNRNLNMQEFLAAVAAAGIEGLEEALITQGETGVFRYNANGVGFREFENPNDFILGFDGDEGRVTFRNNNLSPNTLYFYYVRTVWQTEGQTFSAWVGVSVTTSLVEPPINLRIELAPFVAGQLFTAFDPRFQFVIRFDAPIESPHLHGIEFDFQYSLMADGELWRPPALLSDMMLLEMIATPGMDGFYQFTYLISGLSPGTQYSIRVRTMDLVNNDYSQYSNVATTRTDTDQEAYDRDRDLANLRRYLDDLIAEFLRRHWWTAQDSQNVFSAVYRPSMVNNLLEINGTMIRLAMTGQDINIYYLPQALFLETWRTEQGFIIAKDDMEIAIPSHAFNNIDNEAILQAMQRIRDVRGVEDYFVRITAVIRPHAPAVLIHNEAYSGQEIILSFEVVETNAVIARWDADMLNTLQHRLDTGYYTAPFVAEINEMLDRQESYETMVRRLRQIADIIMNQMAAYVNGQLAPTLERVYEVNYVNRPVTIRLINQPTSAVVNGFRFAGTNWVQQEVNVQGSNRAMRTQGAGAFAFNIRNLNLPGVSQMQGNETLTALFVRYGLHDFLGTDATFNLDNNITLAAVQGIAARLAGAPEAANPQNWLRERGYTVPVRGANSPATTQEAIYTLMAVYEIRTNTSVESLRISNFNAVSGITGLDARFRPAIQAAFELGLYANTNMNPTAPITVEDVLRMILAINQRVTL